LTTFQQATATILDKHNIQIVEAKEGSSLPPPPNIRGILCSCLSRRLSFVRHYYDGPRGGNVIDGTNKNGTRSEAERARLLALAGRMLGSLSERTTPSEKPGYDSAALTDHTNNWHQLT